MSTHVRHHSWDHLARRCCNLRISNDPIQTASTISPYKDRTTQALKPQRKRISDGSIKDGQKWRVDDSRSALPQAYSDGHNYKTRLDMDADMPRRRIAAIEAQEHNKSPEAPSRETGIEQRLAGQHQVHGKYRRDLQTEDKTLGWQETVLR